MARSRRRTTHHNTEATIRSIIRRLDALEQRLQRNSGGTQGPSDPKRRWEILEENALRDQVKTMILNRRLRAEGLRPVALDLSLAERVKKLRQLAARNSAGTAKQAAPS
jgi:hypothetical protein